MEKIIMEKQEIYNTVLEQLSLEYLEESYKNNSLSVSRKAVINGNVFEIT